MFLVALLVIGGFGVYTMTPDERRRALAIVTTGGARLGRTVLANLEECAPWLMALRARSGQPVVALAIAIIYVAIAAPLLGLGLRADADVLVGWGATFGPRTTNGEWWRLLTAVFLHQNVFALVIDLAVILQLGFVVELVFGHLAFGLVFIAAGLAANTVHLAGHPVAVRTGASGGLYGLYGLLIVWAVRGAWTSSELAIPRPGYRLLVPVACVFVLTSIAPDSGGVMANAAALTVGLISGLTLAVAIQETSPAPIRMAAIAASTVITIVLMGVPSMGTTDVRPEIARVLGLESRTAAPYETTRAQFKRGAMSLEALARSIDRQILPIVLEEEERLSHLHGVPPEHRALVADAERYVRLRRESWELRARALHSSSMTGLRLADAKERESLDVLEKLEAEAPRS